MTVTMERMLPLYEAKMLDAYDHRDADVYKSDTAGKRQNQPHYLTDQEKIDWAREAVPISWIREEVLPEGVPEWQIGFSNVTSATNERTMLSAALPRAGVGNSYPVIMGEGRECLLSVFNSFVFDYVTRLKVAGLNLNYFYVKQLPVVPPPVFDASCPWAPMESLRDWITRKVLALSCTSTSMLPMSEELVGHPQVYPWEPEGRFLLRSEIDAAMFHVYGIVRDDVDYIMDTFRIVRQNDETVCGEYRTKRVILGIYDAMQWAIDTGIPYEPIVDIAPLPVAHDESAAK